MAPSSNSSWSKKHTEPWKAQHVWGRRGLRSEPLLPEPTPTHASPCAAQGPEMGQSRTERASLGQVGGGPPSPGPEDRPTPTHQGLTGPQDKTAKL